MDLKLWRKEAENVMNTASLNDMELLAQAARVIQILDGIHKFEKRTGFTVIEK